MALHPPQRGDIYIADLDPFVGHEQGGRRPFLVLSIPPMNRAPLKLAIGLPVTTTPRSDKLHVRLEPGATGLSRVSYAMPEMVRSISSERFRRCIGQAPIATVDRAAAHTGFLLGLGRTKF